MEKCFTDEEYKILLVTLQMVNEDPNKVDSIKKKLELIQADKKEDDVILKTEYSKAFDTKRKGLVLQSYFKYGKARSNFSTGRVDAIGSLEKCLKKFKDTGNTEYLCDVANYAMFRFMYPQNGEYFRHTDSNESAGIAGMSVKEIENFRNGDY